MEDGEMNPDPNNRTVVYNVNCPILAPLVVTEKLQWDGVLKKNVWAHPMFVCTLTDARKQGNRMMARRATVTEADMRRAIKAATECGLTVQECVMRPTEIRLVFVSVDDKPVLGDNPKPKEW